MGTILTILDDIDKSKYERLIEYAYLRCDMFSIRVPANILEEDNEFREGIEHKLKIMESYMIKEYMDCDYCKVYVISLTKELKGFLMEAERLYNWEYPQRRPEDLCFYSKLECWLGSIAHEDMCWIYAQSTVEKEILRKIIGLEFIEEGEDYAPPKLEL